MKNLILLALAFSFQAFAQSAQEEAIILNQELDFLEESAKNVSITQNSISRTEDRMISDTPRRTREDSLERTYFGEEELDSVRTRTAAPKRRILRD